MIAIAVAHADTRIAAIMESPGTGKLGSRWPECKPTVGPRTYPRAPGGATLQQAERQLGLDAAAFAHRLNIQLPLHCLWSAWNQRPTRVHG